MQNFRLEATAGRLDDEGALCRCIDCRGLELVLGSWTHLGPAEGGTAELDGSGSVSVHPATS